MAEREITLTVKLIDLATPQLRPIMDALSQMQGHVKTVATTTTTAFEGTTKQVSNLTSTFKGTESEMEKLKPALEDLSGTMWQATGGAKVFANGVLASGRAISEKIVAVREAHVSLGAQFVHVNEQMAKSTRRLAWLFTWATLSMLGVIWQLRSAGYMLMDPFSRLIDFFGDWSKALEEMITWLIWGTIAGFELTGMMEELGVTFEDIVTTSMELQGVLSALKFGLALVGLVVLRELLPYLKEAAKWILEALQKPEVIDFLKNVAKGLGELVLKLAQVISTDPTVFINAIKSIIDIVDKCVVVLLNLVKMFVDVLPLPSDIKTALDKLFGALTQTKSGAEGVGMAIGRLVAVGAMFVPVLTLLMTLTASVVPFILMLHSAFSALSVIGKVIMWLSGLSTAISAAGGGIGGFIAAVTSLLGPIGLAAAAIAGLFAVFYAVSPTFRAAVGDLLGSLWELLQSIIEFFSALSPYIMPIWQAFWDGLRFVAETFGYAVITALQLFVDSLTLLFRTLTAVLHGDWDKVWEEMSKFAEKWSPKFTEAIMSIMMAIKNVVLSHIEEAYEWGRSLVQRFIDGILAMIDRLRSVAMELARIVSRPIKFGSVPEVGPLKEVPKWGLGLAEEFKAGVEKGMKTLELAVGRPVPAAMAPTVTSPTFNITFNVSGSMDHTILPDIERMFTSTWKRLDRGIL